MQDRNTKSIKWLTYMMFLMFAMTTDAVGVIIPEVMKSFDLSMTAAGLLHYGPMTAIALAGMFLGFLADRLGRKKTILLGLLLFVVNSYMFVIGNSFAFFLTLMIVSGVAIGIFKTAALALIGDISESSSEHTSTMNNMEGFFGVGAIIGPFVISYLLIKGIDWKWLFVLAASLCVVLILLASLVKYPTTKIKATEPISIKQTLVILKDPYALGFSAACFFYVSVEAAIYVWMPTLIKDYDGRLILLATYSLPIFFILRAGGRFIGAWLLRRFNWSTILCWFTGAIFLCFTVSTVMGKEFTIVLLPLSGLFMSVVYPTINSKGISCFPKANHGTIAGVILFFTAAGAAIGPLAMGTASDIFNSNPKVGFILATVFSLILFTGAFLNYMVNPTQKRISLLEESEYK